MKLSDDQLQLTSPGTYGTIASTLHHLVAAEQRYAVRFTGATPTTVEDKDEFPGVAKLRELASVSADQLIEVAAKGNYDVVDVEWPEGEFKLDLGVVIVQALWVWNEVLIAVIFLQDQSLRTLMVGLTLFNSRYRLNLPVVMAGMLWATVPMMALYLLGQRFFIRGLTAGGVKG